MKNILFVARTKNISGGGEKAFLDAIQSASYFVANFSQDTVFLEGQQSDSLDGIRFKDEYLFFNLNRFLC